MYHTRTGSRGWQAMFTIGFFRSVLIFVGALPPSIVPTTTATKHKRPSAKIYLDLLIHEKVREVGTQTCHTHSFRESKKHNRLEWSHCEMDFCIRGNVLTSLLRRVQDTSLLRFKVTRPNCTILKHQTVIKKRKLKVVFST